MSGAIYLASFLYLLLTVNTRCTKRIFLSANYKEKESERGLRT